MALPRQSVAWDERRNSSAVIKPPPNAVPDALHALTAFKRSDPELHAWISEGAPNLSETEHVARFGQPFAGRRAKR